MKGKHFPAAGFIFCLALVLRLLFIVFIHSPSPPASDDLHYFGIAEALIDQGAFYAPDSGQPARSEPLYPLFLAAMIMLGNGSVILVKISQAFLGSLSCLLVFFLFRQIFSYRAAFLAGLITAAHPVFIQQSSRMLTETLFTFLLVAVFTLFSAAAERKASTLFLGSGVCLGLAILTRDIALYLPVFLFIALFYMMEKKKAALKGCLLILLASGVVVSPWIVRNYTVSKEAPLISHDIATRYWTDPGAGFFGDSSANIGTTIKFLPFRLKHLFSHPYGLENLGGNIRYRLTLFVFNGLKREDLVSVLKDWRFWYRGGMVFLHYFLLLMALVGLILGFR